MGQIEAEEGSYLITSIPYDAGFAIKLDGHKVQPEIVNTAFLGCPLTKGAHEVEITYQPPGFGMGMFLSVLGILILMMITIVAKQRQAPKVRIVI